MSNKPTVTHTHHFNTLPILDILENSGLCYSIKNSKLEYLFSNNRFNSLFGIKDQVRTDFEIFIPEIAYELNQEDNLVITSMNSEDQDRVLIGKNGTELVANISRYVSTQNGETVLVSVIKDITRKNQEKQFDAYKKVLSDSDVFEKMLNRFSNLIFSTNKQREILEGVGNLCIELLNLEDVSIFIADRKNRVLKQTLLVGRDKEIKYATAANAFKSISMNEGITGKCARTLKSIIIDDISLDPDYISDIVACKSEIAVPIVYKNNLIGVIDSESSQEGRYTDHIKRTLEGIASLLAIKLNELSNFKRVKHKNAILNSLITDSPAAIAMLDSDFNFLKVSKRWEAQFTDWKNKHLIGENIFTMNPNIPDTWKQSIVDASKGSNKYLSKESFETKKGTVSYVSFRVNPWYKEKNEIGGVIIFSEDITEQETNKLKLANTNKLLNDNAKFGKLFNWSFNVETGYFKWDNNNLEIANFPSETQYSLDTVFDMIDEPYRKEYHKIIKDAMRDSGFFEYVHPFTINEKKFWLQNRGNVNKIGGQIITIAGQARDITEKIEAENAIREQNQKLKKVNQELDQFVYKTAHDLRAPLTNLIGLIDVMRAEDNKMLLNSYFDLQQKSIEKLDTFIQKITDSTKNTRLPKVYEKINFSKVVDQVLCDHNYYENSDKVTKLLNIEQGKLYYSDSERIKIIIKNLVNNAIHFCDLNKKPELSIAITSEADLIRIKVRDNGVGIAANLQNRVFEMFYRAHRRSVGAGIGLYIVKETVNKLNGSIHLTSEEGEFTEINVFLPNKMPANE